MKKQCGFTLIELVIFIAVTSILASTVILSTLMLLRNTPSIQSNLIASGIVTQNIEYYIGLRRTLGYSAIPCPNTTIPSFDTGIVGYTVTESIVCTTINGDANYKTLTTTATGLGTNAGSATSTILFANY
jgi:type II secretory pathway pseudopilin PulG